VTKEPKFRPTMQCQVGPFRSSNYRVLHASLFISSGKGDSYGLLDILGDVLRSVLASGYRGRARRPARLSGIREANLLNTVF
jgi:hypothetical protein